MGTARPGNRGRGRAQLPRGSEVWAVRHRVGKAESVKQVLTCNRGERTVTRPLSLMGVDREQAGALLLLMLMLMLLV